MTMANRYPPINPKFPRFMHGGDYNPDQWLDRPDILNEDIRLAKLADVNTMTLGVFAWTALEPSDGEYNFGWMDETMDRLADNGMYAVLATPSGSRPFWMSQKYPEVLRVRPDRTRNLPGLRHNHCFTSPVYREKTAAINEQLATRYKDHPALLVWHVSNEFNGECHCPLCQEAFRLWLRERYNDDLDALNKAWWTAFWAHTYTDWSQIESPSPIGERFLHGLVLDWKRFVTHQTTDFMLNEMKPLREHTPDIPITTNFMGIYPGLNYWEMAKHLDVISWDTYPEWHRPGDNVSVGRDTSFNHDLNRSLGGGKPFMLMENTPSMTNWQSMCKPKRPGMLMLSSMQAVAHGSDTVQYFQFRKSRGSSEKLHGAVVDHVGHENNRVFQEVAEVGRALAGLDDVIGTAIDARVAIVYDWENRWAIDELQGLGKENRRYPETVRRHYQRMWEMGIAVDIIDQTAALDGYDLVIAPMLYMLRDEMGQKLRAFVEAGGTAVATYWTGLVNETDLCYLGGWPGDGLGEVFGIWDEETDVLYEGEHNAVVAEAGNALGLSGSYETHDLHALIHLKGATALGTYKSDFYAGRPAATVNAFGKGSAYYIASRNDERFLDDFYSGLAQQLNLPRAIDAELPAGVTATRRTDGERDFVFVMNFNDHAVSVPLNGTTYEGLTSDEPIGAAIELEPFGVRLLTVSGAEPTIRVQTDAGKVSS